MHLEVILVFPSSFASSKIISLGRSRNRSRHLMSSHFDLFAFQGTTNLQGGMQNFIEPFRGMVLVLSRYLTRIFRAAMMMGPNQI